MYLFIQSTTTTTVKKNEIVVLYYCVVWAVDSCFIDFYFSINICFVINVFVITLFSKVIFVFIYCFRKNMKLGKTKIRRQNTTKKQTSHTMMTM